MAATDGVPCVEVGCVKDFPGTWAEYRVYEGGIMQVHHRISTPEALAWSERCRHLYQRLRDGLRDLRPGRPGGPVFHHLDPLTARAAFRDASDVFLAATGEVPPGGWDEPGLGDWTVRELTAHALRAFITLQRLCDTTGSAPQLESAMAYYRAVAVRDDVHAGVLQQRGREAGAQLVDPEATARRTAEQALGRLAATADEHVGETFAGPMRLADYLPTRVVELGIHTLDLQRRRASRCGCPPRPPRSSSAPWPSWPTCRRSSWP